MSKKTTIACYYFPNYHVDPRNEAVHGRGWTEWELVRRAEPRFAGHRQPRVPAWGFEDESDPAVMAKKIDAAADHGVDAFLFDWYYYDDGPFLERALDRGFMGAPNHERLKFALMWANHDWVDLHPAKHGMGESGRVLYPGRITRATFDLLVDTVIERYFSHPSYWCIDGCPYFSIYELFRLVSSLGGVEETCAALAGFRAKVRAAGFADLHLNAVVWGVQLLPGEQTLKNPRELRSALGFDSVTSYVWVHHCQMNSFPETDYALMRDEYLAYWEQAVHQFNLPYYPNVSMGWDPSPRTVQSDRYENVGYPFTPILANSDPGAFRRALEMVRDRLDDHPERPRVVTLNAWNEWTEGSYLEPDTQDGFGYLEAVREVFGKTEDKPNEH